MFVKLVVLACTVAVTFAAAAWNGPLAGGLPASLYPAGIDPKACPNFPNCANPAVALTAAVPSAPAGNGYAGAQSWNAGAGNSWNAGAANNWNGGGAQGQWNGAAQGQQWNGAAQGQQWNAGAQAGQWNGAHDNGQWNGNQGGYGGDQAALNKGQYIGDGDYRGEGLAESGAYDGNTGYNGQALNGYNGGQQNGQACANYPYC